MTTFLKPAPFNKLVSQDLVNLYSIHDKVYFSDNGSLYFIPKDHIKSVLEYLEGKTIDEKIDYLRHQVIKGNFKPLK